MGRRMSEWVGELADATVPGTCMRENSENPCPYPVSIVCVCMRAFLGSAGDGVCFQHLARLNGAVGPCLTVLIELRGSQS